MPYMNELYPKYKEKGVEIIALDADETDIAVKNFVNQYGLKFQPLIKEKDYRNIWSRSITTSF